MSLGCQVTLYNCLDQFNKVIKHLNTFIHGYLPFYHRCNEGGTGNSSNFLHLHELIIREWDWANHCATALTNYFLITLYFTFKTSLHLFWVSRVANLVSAVCYSTELHENNCIQHRPIKQELHPQSSVFMTFWYMMHEWFMRWLTGLYLVGLVFCAHSELVLDPAESVPRSSLLHYWPGSAPSETHTCTY